MPAPFFRSLLLTSGTDARITARTPLRPGDYVGTPMRTLALALTFVLAGALPGPAAARGGERVDVLIQFRSPPTRADFASVERTGGSVSRTFRIVPACSPDVSVDF